MIVLFTPPLSTAVILLSPGVRSDALSAGTRISALSPFAAIVRFSAVTLPVAVDNFALTVTLFSVLFTSFTFIPGFAPVVTNSVPLISISPFISRSTGNTAVISFFSTVTKKVWLPVLLAS